MHQFVSKTATDARGDIYNNMCLSQGRLHQTRKMMEHRKAQAGCAETRKPSTSAPEAAQGAFPSLGRRLNRKAEVIFLTRAFQSVFHTAAALLADHLIASFRG